MSLLFNFPYFSRSDSRLVGVFSLLPFKACFGLYHAQEYYFKSAACIDLACFRHLPCAIYILFQVQRLSRRPVFEGVYGVPANTMLGGKLFQLIVYNC